MIEEDIVQEVKRLPGDDLSCGWVNTLSGLPPPRVLRGDHKVRRVVIGAGFTGLAAARRLAELAPHDEVILVEAQRVGDGASGRNMGFVIDLPHKTELASPDFERKQTLMRLNRIAIAEMEKLVRTHSIECQWSRAGKYQGAVGKRGVQFLEVFEKLLRDVGEPFDVLDRKQLEPVLGTSYYERAVFTPGCILMQPAALVRGLARSLPANVTLLENSPIRTLQRQGHMFKLIGREGTIRAEQLVLATDAFTSEFGFMQRRLLPIMTFASMTRPLTGTDGYRGNFDWGLTPADHAGTTVRMTADRRLLIRNHYAYVPDYRADPEQRVKVREGHHEAMIKRYPELAHLPFEYTWGGVTCLSRDFSSFFGEIGHNVFGSFCHNGVGAARGTVSGMLLADLVEGIDTKEVNDMQRVSGMPPRNPPEPMLGMGVRARLKLASWISRHEL